MADWTIWLHAVTAGREIPIHLTKASDSADIDFTDVTDAEVHIQLPQGGEEVITDVTLGAATTTELTITATLGTPPEITRAGPHKVTCLLTVTGSTGPEITKPRVLQVLGKYEVRNG